jgi:cell division transport system permease protein
MRLANNMTTNKSSMNNAMPFAAHKPSAMQTFFRRIRRHRRVAIESGRSLVAAPWSSVMTWLVIGIALSLPAGMLVLLSNVQAVSQGWESSAQISLFIKKNQTNEQLNVLRGEIAGKGGVAAVTIITADQALKEFQQLSGFGEVLEKLETNPLPNVLVVQLTDQLSNTISTDNSHAVQSLFDELRALPAVDQAVLDQAWLQRLQALLQFGRRATALLALVLSLGVVLVIGNTIRLAIENRRNEILVVKLVGGTDAFVRRPFLYLGMWFGLGGGIFACGLVSLAMWWLSAPASNLIALYHSQFVLQYLSLGGVILLLGCGALLGFSGAWLAVWRELNRIEPS